MQSPIRLLFWALLWAGLAAPVQGEVYRWEDAQGNVHFGDRPPAGAATEALDLAAPPAQGSSTAQRLERQRRYLEVTDEERRHEAAERERAAREEARRESRCRQARARLERARSASYLYNDTPDGRVVLDDRQRAAHTAGLRQAVAQWCG